MNPVKYNPTQLDTDQWCRQAKEAGMKYVVLVAKHHDGFCNWPTKYTEYCVRNTPAKKDVVGAVANSAQKHGLKLGLYYSLWDRHEKTHDNNEYAYVEFMKKQLEELLQQYGPVVELWFDGFWKKQTTGWKKNDGSKPTAENLYNRGVWKERIVGRWTICINILKRCNLKLWS